MFLLVLVVCVVCVLFLYLICRLYDEFTSLSQSQDGCKSNWSSFMKLFVSTEVLLSVSTNVLMMVSTEGHLHIVSAK